MNKLCATGAVQWAVGILTLVSTLALVPWLRHLQRRTREKHKQGAKKGRKKNYQRGYQVTAPPPTGVGSRSVVCMHACLSAGPLSQVEGTYS